MRRVSYWPVPHVILIARGVFDLYRNDELLGDKELNRFSVDPAN